MDKQPIPYQAPKSNIYDVIVIGGGPSGSMAAIAAAREGARTLLVEQYGFLGGSLTAMGVGPMMSFHNRAGQQLVQGLPQELVDRLIERQASPGHILDSTGYCSTVTPFDSEALKIELEQMASEKGVHLLFHTMLAGVELQDNRIRWVTLCNKAGLSTFQGTVFIDATGDGDLAAMAGVPFQLGRSSDHATQPITMNLKVGNVDIDRLRAYVHEHPEEFDHGSPDLLAKTSRVSLGGFKLSWKAAIANGEIHIPRDNVLFFETNTPGVIIVNTSRIQGLNPTDPFMLSQAEMIGRQQADEIFRFLRNHAPGFENCIRMDNPSQVGVRESRHIRGLYTLTETDLIEPVQFPDPILLGGYPIDIHSPTDGVTHTTHLRPDIAYQIPLRCLLVETPVNLIITGRAISASHEAAAAIRVTPLAMGLGQAAGILAGIAVNSWQAPNTVPYRDLRNKLIDRGVYLGND
ncbi:MAG TPA: FAD-dependent oxidoreductase [Anaerolineaceae bacterium]